jgi:DNA-binding transcriptional LysR family regulator
MNLNLLVAFEALLEERSVSRAASRIGLSQPAMSNALARLREAFGDPLFLRAARGVTPTARAAELAAPVRAGLAHLRAAVEGQAGFDPSASTRTFRLAMTDYAELLLLGPLLRRVHQAAPGVQVLIRRLDGIFTAPETELRAGTLDAAIGFFPDASALDSSTRVLDLLEEGNVCVARRNHPLMRRRLTAERFAAAASVAVFYRADHRGLIDSVLAGQGLSRRLQATTPHFLAVPYLVAASDLVACVPAGLALRFRQRLALEVRKLPFSLPKFHHRLAWHEQVDGDAAHRWLRELIAEAVSFRERRVPPRRSSPANRQ